MLERPVPTGEIRLRQTIINKSKLTPNKIDEKILLEVHKCIQNGKQIIDENDYPGTSTKLSNLYFFRYFRKYDLMIDIEEYRCDKIDNLVVALCRRVDEEILRVELCCDWDQAKMIIDSYNKPLLGYFHWDECTVDDLSIEETQNYLATRGIVFHCFAGQ